MLLGLAAASCDNGGGDDAGAGDAGIADAGAACRADEECDDGLFCNGPETCVEGACVAGEAVTCDDGVECTTDACDEDVRDCRSRAPDADGDGIADIECLGSDGRPFGMDCDDADPNRFPGNREVCDMENHDEDCDPTTFGEVDIDGDGFFSARCCNEDPMGGDDICGDDCADTQRGINPDNAEMCNGRDDDCDGTVDEGVGVQAFPDTDYDGFGDDTMPPSVVCPGTPGFSELPGDCDDGRPETFPGAAELCEGADNDCDLTVDENPRPVTWYRDLDGDGFGAAASGTVEDCMLRTPDYSLLDSDCDDSMAGINPGAAEMCNGVDDDCNGAADFMIAVNDFEDDDNDGSVDLSCGAPFGVDCDDMDPATAAGSLEICDGRDNDCDTSVDEDVVDGVWYPDLDGDGYGDPSGAPIVTCTGPMGYADNPGDCDDSDPAINPGAAEAPGCNNIDENCDGRIDVDLAGQPLACTATNANGACFGGRCLFLTCDAGFADCNGDAADGCEVDTTTLTNCGGCGVDCNGLSRVAGATCNAGACEITSCQPGFDDCDTVAANGCEADLNRDSNNCMTCGNGCGTGTCFGGACICFAGFDSCGAGNCDTALDALPNCGACGESCVGGPNTSGPGTCGPGMAGFGDCTIAGCVSGFGDCDGDYSSGCEARLDTIDNCRSCGNNCTLLPAVRETRCGPTDCIIDRCSEFAADVDGVANNGCELSCAAGLRNCDGMGGDCESDLNNVASCGMCGNDCRFAPDVLVASCASMNCQIDDCVEFRRDADGFAGNGCEANCPLGFGNCPSEGDPTTCGTDLNTDTNCGSCGNACNTGAGETCISGSCQLPCGGGCAPEQFCFSGTMACEDYLDVSVGDGFTCATLQPANRVVCWGAGTAGQIGPLSTGSVTPVEVVGLPNSVATVHTVSGRAHSCAEIDDQIWCWGDNTNSQLGPGCLMGSCASPVQVTPFPMASGDAVLDLAAGYDHTCALIDRMASLRVFCWGRNSSGQIGNGGTSTGVATPYEVPLSAFLPSMPNGVVAGENFTCVHLGSREFTCFGAGAQGQLGNGSTASSTSPVMPAVTLGGTGAFINELHAGARHVCASINDSGEQLWCWGNNARGEGAGTAPTTSTSPAMTPIVGSNLGEVALGRMGTYALTGTTFGPHSRGSHQFGQLGDGTPTDTLIHGSFVSVGGSLSGISPRSLYAGPAADHVCAIDDAMFPPDLHCWGRNSSGELGRGVTSPGEVLPARVEFP